jgi:hypothetical protein
MPGAGMLNELLVVRRAARAVTWPSSAAKTLSNFHTCIMLEGFIFPVETGELEAGTKYRRRGGW